MSKACTSVFTDSTSSERRTRLSCRSQKKTLRTHVGDVLVQTEVRRYRHVKDADVVTSSNSADNDGSNCRPDIAIFQERTLTHQKDGT